VEDGITLQGVKVGRGGAGGKRVKEFLETKEMGQSLTVPLKDLNLRKVGLSWGSVGWIQELTERGGLNRSGKGTFHGR